VDKPSALTDSGKDKTQMKRKTGCERLNETHLVESGNELFHEWDDSKDANETQKLERSDLWTYLSEE
jgi:hypothetical protein